MDDGEASSLSCLNAGASSSVYGIRNKLFTLFIFWLLLSESDLFPPVVELELDVEAAVINAPSGSICDCDEYAQRESHESEHHVRINL